MALIYSKRRAGKILPFCCESCVGWFARTKVRHLIYCGTLPGEFCSQVSRWGVRCFYISSSVDRLSKNVLNLVNQLFTRFFYSILFHKIPLFFPSLVALCYPGYQRLRCENDCGCLGRSPRRGSGTSFKWSKRPPDKFTISAISFFQHTYGVYSKSLCYIQASALEKKGWTEETMKQFLSVHIRTPYHWL